MNKLNKSFIAAAFVLLCGIQFVGYPQISPSVLSSLEKNNSQFQSTVKNIIENCNLHNDLLFSSIRSEDILFITRAHLETLRKSPDAINQFLATQFLQSASNKADLFCCVVKQERECANTNALGIISIPLILYDTSWKMEPAHLSKHSFHSPISIRLDLNALPSPKPLAQTPLSAPQEIGHLSSPSSSGRIGMRISFVPREESRSRAHLDNLRAQMAFDEEVGYKTYYDFQDDFKNCTYDQIFSSFELYRFDNFLSYIATLPGYDEFMLETHAKLHHRNKKFKYKLWETPGYKTKFGPFTKTHSTLFDIINQLADDSRKRLTQRKEQQQQMVNKCVTHFSETIPLSAFKTRKQGLNAEEFSRLAVFKTSCLKQAHLATNDDIRSRLIARINAIDETYNSKGKYCDYSSKVLAISSEDSHKSAFSKTYGTYLDCQLHKELSEIRNDMIKLEDDFPQYEQVQFIGSAVHRLTATSKEEKNITVAFNLADFSYDVVRFVSSTIGIVAKCAVGLASYSLGTSVGLLKAAQAGLTIEYWVDVVVAIPNLIFKVLPELIIDRIVSSNEEFIERQALIWEFGVEGVLMPSKIAEQKNQKFVNSIMTTFQAISETSWYDMGEASGYYGGLFLLDLVAQHYAGLAVSAGGQRLINKLATVIESTKGSELMAEVAGISKIALEQGAEAANSAVEISRTIKRTSPTVVNSIHDAADILKKAGELPKATTETICKKLLTDREFIGAGVPGQSSIGKLKSFITRVKEKFLDKRLQTGAHEISAKEYLAGIVWAEKEYEIIRQCIGDVQQIARNTGMPLHMIKRIKRHLFYDTHKLDNAVERLHPSRFIAEAWNRLKANAFSLDDLKLLEHEYFEAKFETIFKTDNRLAHKQTELRRPSPLKGL